LPSSALASDTIAAAAAEDADESGWPGYPGLSDDEVFRLVTTPRDIEGLRDWGIPETRPQAEVNPALQVSDDRG
jgi:hypothetical protein